MTMKSFRNGVQEDFKRPIQSGLLAIMFGLLTVGVSIQSQAEEYLVKYRNPNAISTMAINPYVAVMEHHRAGQLYKVDLDSAHKVSSLVSLLANPNIEYVVPNIQLHAFSTPVSDKALASQWALAKIQAEAAWKRAGNNGSRKVIVAVVDTGADYRHKSLAANMVKGYNFIQNNEDPMDITGQNPGHGTHCSGIIGATGDVDGGTIGISPMVSIMPVRFLDENGSGDLNNGVKAIDFAIQAHVDVISASWGAAVPKDQAMPIIEAIQRAEKAGITFVAAASNDGKNNDNYEVYPAKAGTSNTIAVAASSSDDSKPSWSNYGRATVSLAAPGDAILSTLPGDQYGELSGTSMATPLVAGLVALIKAQDSHLNPVQIKALLQGTGDKVSIATACDCRVNALNAIDTVISRKLFIAPNAATIGNGDTIQFEGVYGKAPLTFSSSNPSVASIDNSGRLTAVSNGTTQITVTDATGAKSTSYNINVGASQSPGDGGGDNGGGLPGGDPGQNPPGGGQPGSCPIGDPATCQAICQIDPSQSFCKH